MNDYAPRHEAGEKEAIAGYPMYRYRVKETDLWHYEVMLRVNAPVTAEFIRYVDDDFNLERELFERNIQEIHRAVLEMAKEHGIELEGRDYS